MEAAEAGIKVIVCITEGIPTKDMILVKEYISDRDCRLIGPNCPGIITADESKIGIMPGFIFKRQCGRGFQIRHLNLRGG